MARPQLTETEIVEFREAACVAALEIIGESGVEALTLRSLGQRLGCSYSKPYRYFGDKDQLIDDIEQLYADWIKTLESRGETLESHNRSIHGD